MALHWMVRGLTAQMAILKVQVERVGAGHPPANEKGKLNDLNFLRR